MNAPNHTPPSGLKPVDEIQALLFYAMAFLEMGFESTHQDGGEGPSRSDLMWAAHEHVQRAWGLYAGHQEPHALTEKTQVLVATWEALEAIENARAKPETDG